MRQNVSRKIGNASTGSLLAIVIGWAASQAGTDVPQEVALAAGALLGSLISEIQQYVQEFTNDE